MAALADGAASVLVRARGAAGVWSLGADRPFWSRVDGRVAVSASGTVLCARRGLVLTCAQPLRAVATGDDVGTVEVDVLEEPQCALEAAARVWTKAAVLRTFRCPALSAALASVIGEGDGKWVVGWPRPGDDAGGACEFALLQVAGLACAYPPLLVDFPPRGEPVCVDSHPYGLLSPRVFGGSLSTGVVSVAVGGAGRPAVALTDARCAPGAEGAPLLVGSRRARSVAGIVLPALRRADGEAVELAAVAPIAVVLACGGLESVVGASHGRPSVDAERVPLRAPGIASSPCACVCEGDEGNVARLCGGALGCVVLVRAGSMWGTGVAIAPWGLIVTNAHVVGSADEVLVRRDSGESARARVLFRSAGNPDVALLHAEGIEFPVLDIDWRGGCGMPGTRVIVAGYPLFGPTRASVGAAVTAGVVASRVHGAVLQSTAAVHSGNSGGLLLCAGGRALAIVTSNARNADGRVLPRINFSVPFAALASLRALCEGPPSPSAVADVLATAGIGAPSAELDALWALREATEFADSRFESSEFARYFRKMRSKL